ncbi:hypothetical protein [Streptomyces sp. NPDC017941]|uniref:hypothetical protein n=1 Tax=Streptomyces sp. NPDC017941 TaxID=3365018 RepID=UPI00378C47FA
MAAGEHRLGRTQVLPLGLPLPLPLAMLMAEGITPGRGERLRAAGGPNALAPDSSPRPGGPTLLGHGHRAEEASHLPVATADGGETKQGPPEGDPCMRRFRRDDRI